jgi:hypothetical protein
LEFNEQKDKERHATWLELFYDLIFVVTISQLAFYLHENISLFGFLQFLPDILESIIWLVSHKYTPNSLDIIIFSTVALVGPKEIAINPGQYERWWVHSRVIMFWLFGPFDVINPIVVANLFERGSPHGKSILKDKSNQIFKHYIQKQLLD